MLNRALRTTAVLTGAVLAMTACGGSDDAESSAEGGDLGPVSLQLSWVKNAEFAGEYFADANGHYTFRGQPVGSYQLQFAKAGRTTTWWLNATSQTTATTITLNPTGDIQADTTM